jgi:hypothetical protein
VAVRLGHRQAPGVRIVVAIGRCGLHMRHSIY